MIAEADTKFPCSSLEGFNQPDEESKEVTDDDPSSYTSCSEVEDEPGYFQYPPASISLWALLVGPTISGYKYGITLKDGFKPKVDYEREPFYISLLKRVVDRFAEEAFGGEATYSELIAILTEDEHRRLCRMKEVDSTSAIQGYVTF